ncbi:hypothetical protein ACQPYK_28305 [Streptosporangium sp. CA-135522]
MNDSGQWSGWIPNFNDAPEMTSVFALNGVTRQTDLFGIGTT